MNSYQNNKYNNNHRQQQNMQFPANSFHNDFMNANYYGRNDNLWNNNMPNNFFNPYDQMPLNNNFSIIDTSRLTHCELQKYRRLRKHGYSIEEAFLQAQSTSYHEPNKSKRKTTLLSLAPIKRPKRENLNQNTTKTNQSNIKNEISNKQITITATGSQRAATCKVEKTGNNNKNKDNHNNESTTSHNRSKKRHKTPNKIAAKTTTATATSTPIKLESTVSTPISNQPSTSNEQRIVNPVSTEAQTPNIEVNATGTSNAQNNNASNQVSTNARAPSVQVKSNGFTNVTAPKIKVIQPIISTEQSIANGVSQSNSVPNSVSTYSQTPDIEVNATETTNAQNNNVPNSVSTNARALNIQVLTNVSAPNIQENATSTAQETSTSNQVSNNTTSPIIQENATTSSNAGQVQGNLNGNVINSIRIGVMAKGYPDVVLSENQLKQLEEAIVDVMTEGWTFKLIFDSITYRPGVLIIDCSNHKTASWLIAAIKNLPNWQGVELESRFNYQTPEMHLINVYFPKSAHRDDHTLLRLLSAQNENLLIQFWEVICSIEQGEGKLLTIGVDAQSIKSMEKCHFLLRYRFGKIIVQRRVNPSSSPTLPNNPIIPDDSAVTQTIPDDFDLDEEDLNGIEECFYNVKKEINK